MNETLLLAIYLLLIVLIVLAIAVLIKILLTLNKVDTLLDDVTTKVKSLDKLFNVINFANDRISMIGETVVGFITGGLKKIFKSRNKENEMEEEDYE